jgi:hypothetical protein
MFNKFYDWVGKHSLTLFIFALLVTCAVTIASMIDIVRKPPSMDEYKDGIQHHLVWSNKGECFFVRPYSKETVYLIRVQDCDKK